MSLSARRAWIEMVGRSEGCWLSYVALRKESVDRNIVSAFDVLAVSASLSARRAWIEMTDPINLSDIPPNVALRKESVDRNEYIQAGTGILNLSLSARRAWIEMHQCGTT